MNSLLKLGLLFGQATLYTSTQRMRGQTRSARWSWQMETTVEMMARTLPRQPGFHVDEVRLPHERLTTLPLPLPVQIQPARVGELAAEWVSPWARVGPTVIYYLHGGGYISGSPRTHRLMTAEIARSTRGRLLALDYRLAPEHPYPAAIEDTWLGYHWLLQQGLNPAQIVLAGDSAGAGLCIALLLRLREAGLPFPAGAICLAPWLDLAIEGESVRTNARIDYLNEVLLRGAAHMYLGDTHPYTPFASPLHADLRGLPPLLIQVGTADLLLDDTKRFAARAQAAGVDVTVTLAEEMVHCYQFFYPISSEARQAVRQIERFVRERIKF